MNIFDKRDGKLNELVLENRDPGGINRYASGAPLEAEGHSLMPGWLTSRPNSVTHHTAVALQYEIDPPNAWGFAIVKINKEIALVKTSSTSLNSDSKRDARIGHSFSRQTEAGRKEQQKLDAAHKATWIWKYFFDPPQAPKLEGAFPTSVQMSAGATNDLEAALKASDLGIKHLAMSSD